MRRKPFDFYLGMKNKAYKLSDDSFIIYEYNFLKLSNQFFSPHLPLLIFGP